MKTNYFFLLLMLLPFVFTSCNDDKDKTNNETFKVKYEIVPVNQEDYGLEATGVYTEFKNNKLKTCYLTGEVHNETGIAGNIIDLDIEGNRDIIVNLPWSYETTSVNFWPPVFGCSTGERTELILRIYIDGTLYKEEKQQSPASLTCYELFGL